MSEIATDASASSGSIRVYEFPVLETGNLSFPNGRYIVEFKSGPDQKSFEVIHRVEGAGLISQLISEGLAKFVCMVASPVSSYRVNHVSESSTHTVRWNEDDLGEPPMLIPMIVAAKPFSRKLKQEQHGVHELWDEQKINFKAGMRLAVGNVVQLRSSVLNLLSFHENSELSNGTFQAKAEPQEGFRFRVELAPDLHRFLRFRTDQSSRGHILTHIVSACLSLLQRDYSDDNDEEGGWRSYRGLEALARHLEANELPHWSDEDSFIPELVATKLHPHRIPKDGGDM